MKANYYRTNNLTFSLYKIASMQSFVKERLSRCFIAYEKILEPILLKRERILSRNVGIGESIIIKKTPKYVRIYN